MPDIEDKTHFRGRSKSGHADSETGGHAHSEMTGHLPEMGGHDGLKYATYQGVMDGSMARGGNARQDYHESFDI